MTIKKKMLQAAAGAGGLDIADAFSTDLYTGNGGTQTITNGLDLDGEGGLVWTKSRSTSGSHRLADTERGAGYYLSSNLDWVSNAGGGVSSFNSDGFSLNSGGTENGSGTTYVAWTFRKAPKFFDVVTYTGDGTAFRSVAHNLGITPGLVIVKNLSTAKDWAVGVVGQHIMTLNSTAASPQYNDGYINPNNNTDETFYLNSNAGLKGKINDTGDSYVAYIFAHDTDDDSVIQCGSYTGNGSTSGPVITLGWEPQWLLIKLSAAANWFLYDSQRSPSNPRNKVIQPNLSAAEFQTAAVNIDFNSTGFQCKTGDPSTNASGGTYIYMAIRKEGA
jgi:hypothetical protein